MTTKDFNNKGIQNKKIKKTNPDTTDTKAVFPPINKEKIEPRLPEKNPVPDAEPSKPTVPSVTTAFLS